MATVAEKFQGVSGDRTSRSIAFIVKDAVDAGDAISATMIYLGANYGFETDGIPFQNCSVTELAHHKGLYETTASFSVKEAEEPETGDIEVSFDVNLDTRRIYRSYKTTRSYKAASEPRQEKSYQRLNIQQDDTVHGVDVRVPVGGFQVSWYAPQAAVTSTYRKTVLDTVGKVNNDSFYGHDAGEVLFAGVAGRARNADDWELVFRFEVSPNQTGLTIGEGTHTIDDIDVDGWEKLNVKYTEKTEGTKVVYPQFAWTERVYELADFSQLGIGT